MPIEITKFQEYTKNTQRGFFSVRLTNICLEIQDITLHEKGGSRWVGLPAKPYTDSEGTQKWNHIIHFFDEGKSKEFQKAVLQALDAYLADKKNTGDMGGR